jgi:hypothetical protein
MTKENKKIRQLGSDTTPVIIQLLKVYHIMFNNYHLLLLEHRKIYHHIIECSNFSFARPLKATLNASVDILSATIYSTATQSKD